MYGFQFIFFLSFVLCIYCRFLVFTQYLLCTFWFFDFQYELCCVFIVDFWFLLTTFCVRFGFSSFNTSCVVYLLYIFGFSSVPFVYVLVFRVSIRVVLCIYCTFLVFPQYFLCTFWFFEFLYDLCFSRFVSSVGVDVIIF